MSLNIKNERTHALVRELARITGMSQTSAVEDAVRRRLEELQTGDDEVARKRAAVRRTVEAFHAETTPEERGAMRAAADDMYDELGLPT